MSDSKTQEYNGKKIFFLYPTTSIVNQIIAELTQHEYETYISKDHARLMKALKKYPDSVLFANVDDGMNKQEWERYIGAFHTAMPELKIGVFSSNNDEEFRNHYIEKMHIKCGFMNLKVDMSKTVGQILEVLNILNVKGLRKYLRATMDRDTNASLNLPFHGDFIKGTIKDISVVGFACNLETDPGFQKNELVKDIQIKLQSMLLKVEAVVFGSRKEGEDKQYVFIFTQRVDPDIRVKIRKYIQGNLQAKMDAEIG